MAATPQDKPSGFIVTTNNWFHEGWLAAVLGLTERQWDDLDGTVGDIDIDSWRIGYNTAKESKGFIDSFPIMMIRRMINLGQITPVYRHRDEKED